jgi:predicted DsbA family dithiol-disulfide isomerase
VEKEETVVEVIEYTDPYCTWCWGSEPILRRIKEVYGDQVRVGYKMGGLVADIEKFYDPANEIGGPDWYKQVAAHWLDASSRHGMPVDEKVFYELRDELRSTYPANIAYKSAEFQDEELAKKFLRRMREGAAAERKPINRLEAQASLAKEVGLDGDKFTEDIECGRAEKAFYEDLTEARSRGIYGFPTFLIRNGEGQEIVLRGYRSFDIFETVFQKLVGDALEPRTIEASEDSILAFVRKYGRVAPREIEEVFDITMESAMERLGGLKGKSLLKEEKLGNGFFYSA